MDLYQNSGQVRTLFTLASDLSGHDMRHLLEEGSEEELQQTENTQLAVTLANRSASLALQEQGISAACYAGFSLGELSAMAGAGVIDDEALFAIVTKRGSLMAQASKEAVASQGELGMAAVMGIGFSEVCRVLEDEHAEGLYCANDNSPVQVVISGLASEITRLSDALKAAGAKRILPLRVSGPFHTPFMAKVQEEYAEFLHKIPFKDPVVPLYANVTGLPVHSGDEARALSIQQLFSPVRWNAIMQAIACAEIAGGAVEAGPGTVLSGFWRASGTNIVCTPAGTYEQIVALAHKETQDA